MKLDADYLPFVAISVAKDGVVKYMNEIAIRTFALDVTGKHVNELIPEPLRDVHDRNLNNFWRAPLSRNMVEVDAVTVTGSHLKLQARIYFKPGDEHATVLMVPLGSVI